MERDNLQGQLNELGCQHQTDIEAWGKRHAEWQAQETRFWEYHTASTKKQKELEAQLEQYQRNWHGLEYRAEELERTLAMKDSVIQELEQQLVTTMGKSSELQRQLNSLKADVFKMSPIGAGMDRANGRTLEKVITSWKNLGDEIRDELREKLDTAMRADQSARVAYYLLRLAHDAARELLCTRQAEQLASFMVPTAGHCYIPSWTHSDSDVQMVRVCVI